MVKQEILAHLPDYKAKKTAANRYICDAQGIKSDYILTKKRRTPFRLLVDQMAIRKLRSEKKLSSIGVRGTLLEGNSGIGKSSLAVEGLTMLGFQDITSEVMTEEGVAYFKDKKAMQEIKEHGRSKIGDAPSVPSKYVHLTPAAPDELKRVLLHAFHKGYVVIIDELNLLPCEHLLNHLLSGRDLEGNKPKQEGFYIIATQNQSTAGGRLPLSCALLNRFEICPMQEDSDDVLKTIFPAEEVNRYRWHRLGDPNCTQRDLFDRSFAEKTVNPLQVNSATGGTFRTLPYTWAY